MDTDPFIKNLESIVGQKNVIYHPEDLLAFEYDGSIDKGLPEAVVLPSSTEEIRQVIILAYDVGIPVVGRGSGTGLSAGAIASMGGIQIVFTRMNKILEIDTENRLAVVEPGVINWDLDKSSRKYGLRYAPDPSSEKACTIGGNVAENAGGPHCLLYGVTSNHVLALEIVLEDGNVVWLGDRVRELPGYDLRGVFIASEGTFGLITKVVVKLMPLPEATKTLLGIFPDIETACSAVSAVIGKGIVPAALEMIDDVAIKAVGKVMKAGYPEDAGAILLAEVEGMLEEVEILGRSIEGIFWETGARQLHTAEDESERDRLWAGRKGAIGAMGTLAPNYYLVDGVVPRTKLTQVMKDVLKIAQEEGFPIANIFHAGDGNIHPCILFDEREPGVIKKVMSIGARILQVCVEAGGTLTGEHGVGLEKKEQMPLVFTEEDMNAMKKVRFAFSPLERMNPGKIFPGGPEYHESMQRKAMAKAGPESYI